MKVKVDKTLVASIALHVLVLGWGLLTFSSKAYIAQESLPVDIISSDQLARIMSGQKTGDKKEPKPKVEKIAEAKPEEDAVGKVTEKKELIKTNSTPDTPPKPVEKPVEKKPDPPKPVAETKPKEEPKPQEKKPDPAKEDPIAELQKKLETKKPPPKPVEQKVAAVQPQPKPKERTFDPAQIARDLDKRAATRHELTGAALNASASLGSTSGTAASNVATWQGAFVAAVKHCFNFPYDAQDKDQFAADIDIQMRPDGTLASVPVIVAVRGPSRTIANAMAESAKRAIQECQAYAFLPKAQYDTWKTIALTFDMKDQQ
ncbi:protein TolA [Bradyrhizobium sp. GCM10027634]|uniref:protein TolA n=1 Tax=unclassified Bradyrhizobium TaxID=2631580 RepID=UPI00188AA9F1|nr:MULTISPECIES: protein TolA [unclassified Bradyrhizobium]MDN5000099.1 protein TolA [Bradyrhizobium sp. WYCCWR 12677]QOZ43111.1 protein TolA [Bradyrhizobium sp. CCBAU 53340]